MKATIRQQDLLDEAIVDGTDAAGLTHTAEQNTAAIDKQFQSFGQSSEREKLLRYTCPLLIIAFGVRKGLQHRSQGDKINAITRSNRMLKPIAGRRAKHVDYTMAVLVVEGILHY